MEKAPEYFEVAAAVEEAGGEWIALVTMGSFKSLEDAMLAAKRMRGLVVDSLKSCGIERIPEH